jgi:hypothetical protein
MSAEDSGSDPLIQLPKLSREPDIYASYPIWPCKHGQGSQKKKKINDSSI